MTQHINIFIKIEIFNKMFFSKNLQEMIYGVKTFNKTIMKIN